MISYEQSSPVPIKDWHLQVLVKRTRCLSPLPRGASGWLSKEPVAVVLERDGVVHAFDLAGHRLTPDELDALGWQEGMPGEQPS